MGVAESESPQDADIYGPGGTSFPTSAIDVYTLVVILVIAAGWTLAALPDTSSSAGKVLLSAAVACTAVAVALQFLTHQRHFGYDPPLAGVMAAIVAGCFLAPYHGQASALLALCGGAIAAYTERLVKETEHRFVDTALAITAVVLFGFLPMQVLLIRMLPLSDAAFFLFLLGAFVFTVTRSLLLDPRRPQFYVLDTPTLAGVVGCVGIVAVAAGTAGGDFSVGTGFLVGGAIAGSSVAGQLLARLLAPPPPLQADGRRRRRRPLLLDALMSVFTAAAAAYFVLRVVLV